MGVDGLGEQFILACIEDNGFAKAVEHGFKEKFLSEPLREVWAFALEVIRDGGCPDATEIQTRFGIKFPGRSDASLEAIVRLLKDRSAVQDMRPIFNKALELVSQGKPNEAMDEVLKVANVRAEYNKKILPPISQRKSYKERILSYKVRQKSQGVKGARTPWGTLTNAIRGWQNMNVLAGYFGTGKTWELTKIADSLASQGFRPLLVGMEMSVPRHQLRLDCVRYMIPFPTMRDASMPPEEEEKWFKAVYAEGQTDGGDVTIVGKQTVQTVTDIELLWQQYRWTHILVDGGYRLRGPKGSTEWSDQAAVVRQIQLGSERMGVPWIVTTQLGDSNETGKGVDNIKVNRWKIRYAKEWLMDPDVVVFIKQDADLRAVRQLKHDIEKHRDGDGERISYFTHLDLHTMNLDEVTPEEYEGSVLDGVDALESSATLKFD